MTADTRVPSSDSTALTATYLIYDALPDFRDFHSTHVLSQGHWGSTGLTEPLLRTTATTNMAAANFVVITNGEGCTLTGTTDIDL